MNVTSDQPDSASPVLRQIAKVRKITRRAAIVAGLVGLLSPLAAGLAIGAGATPWLWSLPALALLILWVDVIVLGINEARDRRFRAMRAAAEDLAAEREKAPDGSGS